MGITQTPSASGYSVPNWQLISSASPSGVVSYTFSGISGYSKLRLVAELITAGASGTFGLISIQPNADSTATHYLANSLSYNGSTFSIQPNSGAYASLVASNVQFAANSTVFGEWEIDNANNSTAPKNVNFWLTSSPSITSQNNGTAIFTPTAAITSILFGNPSGTATISGNLYLLGAN